MKKVILGILVLVFGSVLSANDSGLETLKKQCENGNPYSCTFYYRLIINVEQSSINKLEKECKKGNMDSCFELSFVYIDKKDNKKKR